MKSITSRLVLTCTLIIATRLPSGAGASLEQQAASSGDREVTSDSGNRLRASIPHSTASLRDGAEREDSPSAVSADTTEAEGGNDATWKEALRSVRQEIESLKAHNDRMQRTIDTLESALEQTKLIAVDRGEDESLDNDGLEPSSTRRGRTLQTSVSVASFNQLTRRVDSLYMRLACVNPRSNGDDFIFQGCNVHVRNGGLATGVTNGRGNLVVGYNAAFGDDSSQRTGSHNVIVGDYHRWTSYSSIAAGHGHTIGGLCAAAVGGTFERRGAAALESRIRLVIGVSSS